MLVWQDMPSPGLGRGAETEFEAQSAIDVKQLYNYPSIVVWVLFNEDWGAYDQERLAKWMKQLDPSRLLNGHSGGYILLNGRTIGYTGSVQGDPESKWISSDIADIHSYPGPDIPPALPGKARILGEFGGVSVTVEGHDWDEFGGWDYYGWKSPAELVLSYDAMSKRLQAFQKDGLSGSIYTQTYDVEIEENGLMTYDRRLIKIPLEKLRQFNERLVAPTPVGSSPWRQ